MTSRLLTVLVLAVLMQSSEALTCYFCSYCAQPTSQTCNTGDVCLSTFHQSREFTY